MQVLPSCLFRAGATSRRRSRLSLVLARSERAEFLFAVAWTRSVGAGPLLLHDHACALCKVVPSGVLTEISNITVSGKGRRYRMGWETRNRRNAADVDEAFRAAVKRAVGDILRHADRREPKYSVIRGDSRSIAQTLPPSDIAV